jgi:hypothetical protein
VIRIDRQRQVPFALEQQLVRYDDQKITDFKNAIPVAQHAQPVVDMLETMAGIDRVEAFVRERERRPS